MPNVQTFTVVKQATARVTHTHNFNDTDHPDASPGVCRCGKTPEQASGPVEVTETQVTAAHDVEVPNG